MGGKKVTLDEVKRWTRLHVEENLSFTEIAKKVGRLRGTVSTKVRGHTEKEKKKEEEAKKREREEEKRMARYPELFKKFKRGESNIDLVIEGHDPDEVEEAREVFSKFAEEEERRLSVEFEKLGLKPEEAAEFYQKAKDVLPYKGKELLEKLGDLMEAEKLLDRVDLSADEARERLDVAKKIEDLESEKKELLKEIEEKKSALAGLKTELGERIGSLSSDLESSVTTAILAILSDDEIKGQLSRMFMWGYSLHDVQSLYQKIIKWIRKSQEQLLGQVTG